MRLLLDWLSPALVAAVAIFLYINGAFFSTISAVDVDFSVNFTASHAIRDGEDPYGSTTLLDRAHELGSPPHTTFIYMNLFTSYIQPPTSAVAIMPLTYLPWRQASRAFVLMSNVFLIAATVLTLYTVRPTLPWQWTLAGAAVVLMAYTQIYGSLALGQWDATMTLLLAIALWGYKTRRPAVSGAAIAIGAAIKLVPAVLLLYFLWKREYRVLAWAAAVGLALFVLSLPITGVDIWRTYLADVLPALLKGSTHYANVSLGSVMSRAFIEGDLVGQKPIDSLAELQALPAARALTALAAVVLLAAAALIVGRGDRRFATTRPEQLYVVEFYLVVAIALIISSVTWEFYVVWLMPLFLAAFLAAPRVLPGRPAARWAVLAALVLAFVLLNYPGDLYLFDVNAFFYRPQWVPGVWVEDRIQLYHGHSDAIPPLRCAALLFLVLTLCAVLLDSTPLRRDSRA